MHGIYWIGIGVIICILTLRYDLGSLSEPGPGFIAFLSGLFISGVGMAMIISRTFSKNPKPDGPNFYHTFGMISWPRLGYTAGLLWAYALFLNNLGYMLSTFLLMFGMFYDWEKKNWTSGFIFSIATVLVSYLIFQIWLRCQLPRGVFPWW